MNINWTTVFFQMINFLIVVWILKKYLFKPVLSSMDKREQTIQDRLKDAEKSKKETEIARKELEEKIASLEKSKDAVMAKAIDEANAEHSDLLKKSHQEIQKKKKEFEEQMISERESLRLSIKDITSSVVVDTVSSALSDLANKDIQNVILENFIDKLSKKDLKNLTELQSFYKKSKKLNVNTSFEIDDKSKNAISDELSKLIGEKSLNINFKIDDSLLCGIEIICDSLSISFGMNTYINELKINLDNAIAGITKTPKQPKEKNNK